MSAWCREEQQPWTWVEYSLIVGLILLFGYGFYTEFGGEKQFDKPEKTSILKHDDTKSTFRTDSRNANWFRVAGFNSCG